MPAAVSEAAKPDPAALSISAVGLIDPSDPRYQSDKALAQSDLRADSKSQLVEKALTLLLDRNSLSKNYDLLKAKVLSNSGNYITAVVQNDWEAASSRDVATPGRCAALDVIRRIAPRPTSICAAHRFVIVAPDTRIALTDGHRAVRVISSTPRRSERWRKNDRRVSRDAAHPLHRGNIPKVATHAKWDKAAAAAASKARYTRRDKAAAARPAPSASSRRRKWNAGTKPTRPAAGPIDAAMKYPRTKISSVPV